MAGIFETLKGWMGTLGGSSQADEERKKALLKFAEDHNLAGKPFSIGAVHDVRMKDPTSVYHRNGKDLSEVMFYDKGDGMNLYVGDVSGARDIYSGRIFDNVLSENGLSVCNINQLTPASQKVILDQTAFKVCYQHMINEGAQARANAIFAVRERMTEPGRKSFKGSQIDDIETYLADYIPIGQQKVAAGALIAAADDVLKHGGDKEKHDRVLKEIDNLVSEVVADGKSKTAGNEKLNEFYIAATTPGSRYIDYTNRERLNSSGEVQVSNDHLYIEDGKKGFLSRGNLKDFEPSVFVDGVRFENGKIDSIRLAAVPSEDNPDGRSIQFDQPWSKLDDSAKMTVLDHLAKCIVVNHAETPDNRQHDFTAFEKGVLERYAELKGASNYKERCKVFDGLLDSLSFGEGTDNKRISGTKEALYDMSMDLELLQEDREKAVKAMIGRIENPSSYSFSPEQMKEIRSYLDFCKDLGRGTEELDKALDEAKSRSNCHGDYIDGIRKELQDAIKYDEHARSYGESQDFAEFVKNDKVKDSYQGMSDKQLLALVDRKARNLEKMDDLTYKQAKMLQESGIWKKWTPQQLVTFQAFQSHLSTDLDSVKAAASKMFGRTVSYFELPSKKFREEVDRKIPLVGKQVSTDAGKQVGKGWAGLINGAGDEKTAISVSVNTLKLSSEDFYKTPIHETRMAEAARHAPLSDSDYAEKELQAEADANVEKALHDRFEELMKDSEKEEQGRGIKR